MHKLSVVALRKLTSHPSMVLTGVSLVVLVVVLGAAFTVSIEGERGRSVFTTQVTPVYAATPGDQGQAIFEQNCTGCHTIGRGVLIGPDLQGVTERREESWLKVHILSPSVHRTQGDPIAKANVEEFGMGMPDLGLTEQQVEAVIAYLKTSEIGPAAISAEYIPTLYIPTLVIGILAIVGLTLIGLIAGRKRVEVRL